MAYNPNFGGYGAPPGPPAAQPGYAAPYNVAPGYPAPTAPGYAPTAPGYAPPGGNPGQWAPAAAPVGYAGPPGPAPGISPELWNWFQTVDSDHNGHITAEELQRALLNGNWTPFNAETCRLMIGMFDLDRNGTIDIHEFGSLWKYINDWKACFERFDTDRSGSIDANELQNAFRTFGYQLSVNFTNLCIRLFDRRLRRSIAFDDFIQCCVMVKTLTDRFREKDATQSGVLKVHYEEFLRMALDNKVV